MTHATHDDFPRAWMPRLRMTHCRGRPHHAILSIGLTGQDMKRALELDERAPGFQELRSAERCRIEPRDATTNGCWQLANDGLGVVCALNGRRIRRGQSTPIIPGDELELGLLRFVIEAVELGTQTTRRGVPRASEDAAFTAEPDAASNAGPDLDLHDLAGTATLREALTDPPQDILGIPGFALTATRASAHCLEESSLLPVEALGLPSPSATSPDPFEPTEAPREDDVMGLLHREFERAVRAPAELHTRSGWSTPAVRGGEAAPNLDQLTQSSDRFHLLRDVLQHRAHIDDAIAHIDTLGSAASLAAIGDEEVLSLFAPELARLAPRKLPELTRREHHGLSPDSPVRIGHLQDGNSQE